MEKALKKSSAEAPTSALQTGEPKRRGVKDALEWVMHLIFMLCGIIAVAFVLFISIYLIISGVPAIREIGLVDFLFGQEWSPTASDPSFGILPFILTSVYGTAGAILIGVPIGLMTAVFLAKVANPKVAAVIHTAVELLAGIPSVVYGLVGMILLVPGIQRAFDLSSGACLLAAILVLAIMILPSIISVSETSLRAVPEEYEQASLALGATHLETVFRVSIPAARSGVATAIVLGVGRAIGEAMAIIMVAGNVANMPGLFTSVRFLTTAIASEMSYASVGSLHRNALFSIGLVLFLFIMLINVFLNVFFSHSATSSEVNTAWITYVFCTGRRPPPKRIMAAAWALIAAGESPSKAANSLLTSSRRAKIYLLQSRSSQCFRRFVPSSAVTRSEAIGFL